MTDKARENSGHPHRNIYYSNLGHCDIFVCGVWEGEIREGESEWTYKASLKKAIKPTTRLERNKKDAWDISRSKIIRTKIE